jgi:hypothetical protein
VSKATATNPEDGYSRSKGRVIPSDVSWWHLRETKGVSPPRDGPSWYQVVGGVMAHQA